MCAWLGEFHTHLTVEGGVVRAVRVKALTSEAQAPDPPQAN